ncbi:glycoside hydrolase family 88/105 protein [Plebeiibacterium marinum]|uniref:Glycoside hydrolase family 88 protein n=1 Tax=Plebeiibacterium marinum TaxID=2992111 RepID=A0AAE3MFC6_9BACT|nr:glycoside hydrolase family 88 protein [Plebeiobacterium marinum]MCW3806943.1 glycoside hydrolase family 88 protein [Plebeiobacterium marinum]
MRQVRFIVLVTALSCFWGLAQSQKDIDREDALKSIVKVNSYFMEKYSDYTATSNVGRVRPSNIWTRGVYYEGLMALYSILPKEEYYRYAYDWAAFHKWGYRDGTVTRNADDYCAGQTYIDLYRLNQEPVCIRKVRANLDMLVNTPQNDDWWWIDAIQMGMPVFAKLGATLNEPKYWDKMWDMYEYCRNQMAGKGLYNAEDDLWWRDGDFIPPYKEPNGEDCYWSRGNGWVYAALVRVLSEIPADEKHYKDYVEDFMAMTKALVKCQRNDGYWNVSLHDPKNYGGKEVTGTSLFVYGMAWGINNGLLPKDEYLPIITKAWNSITKDCIHENGFLGYVQGTGKEPKDGQPVKYDSMPDFEDYGIGCFLLAGVEVYKIK